MRIVRLKPYLRACKAMGLDDEGMRRIELGLAAAPLAHPMMRGLRGVRKARFALQGRGKSGGGRVIYYVAVAASTLFLLTAYPKNEADDLTPAQRKAILATLQGMKGTSK